MFYFRKLRHVTATVRKDFHEGFEFESSGLYDKTLSYGPPTRQQIGSARADPPLLSYLLPKSSTHHLPSSTTKLVLFIHKASSYLHASKHAVHTNAVG